MALSWHSAASHILWPPSKELCPLTVNVERGTEIMLREKLYVRMGSRFKYHLLLLGTLMTIIHTDL